MLTIDSDSMKIAYIVSSLANSGPVIVVCDLVSMMLQHGHKVEVFYFDDKVELDFPCATHRITMRTRFRFADFDLVHCHGLRPDIYVLLHKPFFCKTPVCTTIHSYMFRDHAYKYGRWQSRITVRLVLASTFRDDKIILLSRDMQRYYEKYLPECKLTYAYNSRICNTEPGLGEAEKKELLAFKGDSILLCSVSGLNHVKGLHQIIRVLPQLPHFKYCIVGDGAVRNYLEDLAARLNVEDRVLFVGRKPAGFRYLSLADVFVMPSYSEGFPLAMLEAASMGKAAVCSDIPVFREIFSEDEIVMFDLDNCHSLQNALLYAFDKRTELGANMHRKFMCTYSPECFYNRHIEIYQDLIH